MSGENETKKLLKFKASLENRLNEIEIEMIDIRKALEHIDEIIVQTGFRTFSIPAPPKPASAPVITQEELEQVTDHEEDKTNLGPSSKPDEKDIMKITGKDGTVLGTIIVKGKKLTFAPSEAFEFTTDIPEYSKMRPRIPGPRRMDKRLPDPCTSTPGRNPLVSS